jgi:hypothetical protein
MGCAQGRRQQHVMGEQGVEDIFEIEKGRHREVAALLG